MALKKLVQLLSLAAFVTLSGCASYRTVSNIDGPQAPVITPPKKIEIFSVGESPGRSHKEIRRVEVSVKKLTLFHKDPTKEQANEVLRQKAASLGADAVKDVQYQSGVGLTTWGYIDAQGIAIKYD